MNKEKIKIIENKILQLTALPVAYLTNTVRYEIRVTVRGCGSFFGELRGIWRV